MLGAIDRHSVWERPGKVILCGWRVAGADARLVAKYPPKTWKMPMMDNAWGDAVLVFLSVNAKGDDSGYFNPMERPEKGEKASIGGHTLRRVQRRGVCPWLSLIHAK